MLKLVTTYTRPSADVPFFVASGDFTTMYQNKYLGTGKVLEMTRELSEDGLNGIVTVTWRTRADFAEFLDEPLIDEMKAARQVHMEANGITSTQTIEFTPSFGDPGSETPSQPA